MFRKKLTSIITSAVMCLAMTSGVITASAEETDEKLYTFDELSAMSDEEFLKLDDAQELYDRIKEDVEYYYLDFDGWGQKTELFGGISGDLYVNVTGKEYTANITETKIETLLGNHVKYEMFSPIYAEYTEGAVLYDYFLWIGCNDLEINGKGADSKGKPEISDSNILDMAKFWYCVNQVIEIDYLPVNNWLDPAPSNEKVIPGDVNLDKKIDLTDIEYMEKGLSGELNLTELQKKIADVNGDGEFNNLDVEILNNQLTTDECTVPEGAEPTKYGDVNLDSYVNVSDVVYLNLFMLNPEAYPLTDTQIANSDCLRDNIINLSDVSLLANYIVEIIDESKLGE